MTDQSRPSLPDLPVFCTGPFSVNRCGWIVGVDAFGGPCQIADIRGWGYLTGLGQALALDGNSALKAQMKAAQFIADAMNEKMARTAGMRDKIAAIRYAGTTIGLGVADAILAALPNLIPDLVWEDIGGYHYHAPAPLFGNIRIESYTEGKFDVVWSVPGFCDVLVPEGFPTAEAAKDAANAHHRAAIAKAAGWV